MAHRASAPQDDIDRIMAVMATAFDPNYNEAWTRAQVSGALLMGNCHYRLIAADGSQPLENEVAAGFALLRSVCDEEELLLLAVDPGVRRRGIGSKLLEWIISDASARGIVRIFLEMRQGNRAEALYRAHRFQQVGTRPDYYRDRYGNCINGFTFCCKLTDSRL